MLDDYFADGPYKFQMHFGRGTIADFYGATDQHEAILAERGQWLTTMEERCLVMRPEGESLLDETVALAVESRTLPEGIGWPGDYKEKARLLGLTWEPDFLLLSKREGRITLSCACVCFPSSWSVEEKIGRAIAEIHEVVPGLNNALGSRIEIFLERMKPGVSWVRSNWGLSRSAERNQHPSRNLPRLDAGVGVFDVFFRVEEQSLVVLPQTGGILFGIRIKVFPLSGFVGKTAGDKLRVALETMPEEMARYKGLREARRRIVELLG